MNYREAKEHIEGLLNQGIRLDGRKLTEYRKPIKVEPGFIETAEGSARVIIGETEVIVGVKMAVEEPYPDTPDQGNLMVGAELTPLSNPEFESGPPGIQAIELARVIDRGIRESKMIDSKKLCIKKGEKVWAVMIDISPINDAGNLFDAGALGAIAALKSTRFPEYDGEKVNYKKHTNKKRFPEYDGEKVNYKKHTNKKLPLNKIPISVTVHKIGEHLIIDPLTEEENVSDARLTVVVRDDGKICALQKGGSMPLSSEELDSMLKLGAEKSKELRKFIE